MQNPGSSAGIGTGQICEVATLGHWHDGCKLLLLMQSNVRLRGSEFGQSRDWLTNEYAGEFEASARVGRGRESATRRVVRPRRTLRSAAQPPPIPYSNGAANDDGATNFYREPRRDRSAQAAPRRPQQRRPSAPQQRRPSAPQQRRPSRPPQRSQSAPQRRRSAPPPQPRRSTSAPAQLPSSQSARASSPTYLHSGLQLPVYMLFLQRVKLVPSSATITEISRSVAFVSCAVHPSPGRQVVIRVAHDGGAGVAVGHVQKIVKGVGFAVRLHASTGEFRAYADGVCSYLQGESPSTPPLAEPISIQIL